MDLKKLILKPAIQFTPQNSPEAQVLLEGFKVGLEEIRLRICRGNRAQVLTSLFVAELMLMPLSYRKRRLEIYSLEGIKWKISIK